MFEVSIPKISDEEMMKRYKQIKPVITVNGKLHYFREYTLEELSDISYLWNYEEDVREEVGKDELEVLEGRDFVCTATHTMDFSNQVSVKFFPKLMNIIFILSKHLKSLKNRTDLSSIPKKTAITMRSTNLSQSGWRSGHGSTRWSWRRASPSISEMRLPTIGTMSRLVQVKLAFP